MSNKTLYRIPERGVLKGVCAGIAEYLGVPAGLIRAIALLSIVCGLFVLPVGLYIALAVFLPEGHTAQFDDDNVLTPRQNLNEAATVMNECEQRLRRVERYVTSDAFNVRSRFRDL